MDHVALLTSRMMSSNKMLVNNIRKLLPGNLKCHVCKAPVTVQGEPYRIFGDKFKTREIKKMLEKLLNSLVLVSLLIRQEYAKNVFGKLSGTKVHLKKYQNLMNIF